MYSTTTTPIYDSVAADQGWSPEELSEPFDLDWFLRDSMLKTQVHRRLINARDKEAAEKAAVSTNEEGQ